MQTLARILVPTMDNARHPLAVDVQEYVETALLDAFGGWTRSVVEGAWRDPETGLVHRDSSLAYDVLASPERATVMLRALAAELAYRAAQIVVYTHYGAIHTELVPANRLAA